jgi:hypothetical protein
VEISAAKPGSVTRSEVPVPPKNSAPVENPADGAPKQPLSASRHLESAISSPIDAIASTGEKRSHGSDFARRDADLAQASKVREKAAGSAAADAPKSKPSLWKSGFGSIGKHILEEEIITGDPVRDWEIRQQAGVQDVKTILAAATVIAPGLSVSGKVAADGIKGALASGAIKVAAGGAKSAIKAAAAKVPGGPTFATPNGAPVVGALEAAPALEVVPTAVERSAAMAAKALLVPLSIAIKDDDSAVFFAKKDGEEKSQIADQSKGSDPSGGTGPSKKPEGDNERKIDTPKMRNDFVKEKEKSGEWIKLHEPKGGKSTWRNKDSTQYFQKTMEKNEIEVYNKHGKHIGVIKPNDGALRRELAKLGRKIEK